MFSISSHREFQAIKSDHHGHHPYLELLPAYSKPASKVLLFFSKVL